MPSRQVLESHPLSHLKKEISQTNIKGYSKLKKDGIIDLMLKHKDRFHHIQMYKLPERVKKEKPKAEPKAEPKKKVIKKKVVIKDKPFSADCSNAMAQAEKIIRFYTKNKGIFSKEKFLIKNKVDLQNKVDTIKKILIDPKCKDIETDPPFRPLLEKSLALHLENKDKKPKAEPKEEPKEVEGVITLKEFIEEYKEAQENGDLPPKKLTDKEFKEAYEKFLKRPENKPKAKKVEPKKKKIIKKKPEPKKEEVKKVEPKKKYKVNSLTFDGTNMKDFDEFFRKNF